MAVTIEELTVADEPRAWEALGFAVEGDACLVGAVRIRMAGHAAGRESGAGKGLVGWSLRGLVGEELDGLPTRGAAGSDPASSGSAGSGPVPRSTPAPGTALRPAPAPSHPNGVAGLDHVVAISPDLERTVAALGAAGLDLRRIREQPTPTGAPRQAFFRLGAVILEVVQEPAEAIERGGGPDRPAFFWGLAFLAPDLEASVAAIGAELVGGPRAAVQPGRRIATLRRDAGLSLPAALITPPVRGPGAAG